MPLHSLKNRVRNGMTMKLLTNQQQADSVTEDDLVVQEALPHTLGHPGTSGFAT